MTTFPIEETKETSNYFTDLARVNVGQYIDKKGQFSYLSWSHAVDQVKRYDPNMTWRVMRFPQPGGGPDIPWMITPAGCFVEVEVTVKGRTVSQLQPIMDFKNKAMQSPDVMDVNKAIQRCLVKGIASHGLGLYIYSGEDLPNDALTSVQHRLIHEKVQELAHLRNAKPELVIASLKVPSVDHLTTGEADMVIDRLESWIKMAKEAAAKQAATPPEKESKDAEAPKSEEPVNA